MENIDFLPPTVPATFSRARLTRHFADSGVTHTHVIILSITCTHTAVVYNSQYWLLTTYHSDSDTCDVKEHPLFRIWSKPK